VERIIKVAARINSNKTARPLTRVVRDAVLPVILWLTTNSKQVNQQYRYDIDWDTPISSTTA
jgi:FAD-dependent urate hydroxylase